jgi:hypothetical protein
MAKLQWVTNPGDIANLLIGVPASIELLAFDTANNNPYISYNLISGSLPPGMTLSSSGVISGTPVYSTSSNNYFTVASYEFVVRVTSNNGYVLDGGFSIVINNTVNEDFAWSTPAGYLGTIPEGEYYSLQLLAESSSNLDITYSFISGQLPPGMQLIPSGYLTGVPTILSNVTIDQFQTYEFTVRATNSLGHIIDQYFYLDITSVNNPIIEPTTGITTNLGTYFDGTFYKQQLTVIELNPNANIQWSIESGSLPPGLELSDAGLITGYIQPLQLVGAFGPAGYDGDLVTQGVVVEQEPFDYAPYDFNQLNQSKEYRFSIQAYDGANYDTQNYFIEVVSRTNFSGDSSIVVNDTYLTVDSGNVYLPVIVYDTTVLPPARQNAYYAYKFQGVDFSGDSLTYSIPSSAGTFDAYVTNVDIGFDSIGFDSYVLNTNSTTSNLPGLVLDANSGWLYGRVLPQSSAIQNIEFGIIASKVINGVTYASQPVYFTLPVLGDINNVIEWVSDTNLGTIDNGSISNLSVVAKTPSGADLYYFIYDSAGYPARLPQGLTLLPSGDISGRVSFESFSVDRYLTTFDGGTTTVDKVCKFNVIVANNPTLSLATLSSIKEFEITINVIDNEPYDNLYLQAMPDRSQRQLFNSVINNTEIFDPEYIYKPLDPWFGIQPSLQMLFMSGLNPATLSAYQQAMVENYWTKTYQFGDIKTAVVLDKNYNIEYEVVYVEVIDPEENNNQQGAELVVDLSTHDANPYIDSSGNTKNIIYPNSSANMMTRLQTGVGYYDQSSLPDWMTSNQPGATASTFDAPIGFTQAVVLAYTLPGKSNLIAYRLKQEGINFGNIEFTVDRLLIDNYYSKNFTSTLFFGDGETTEFTLSYLINDNNLFSIYINDVFQYPSTYSIVNGVVIFKTAPATNTLIQIGSWNAGIETTFDSSSYNEVGSVVATVNYGVTVPFDQINGRPVDYINSNGGIDGVTAYASGQTMIFIKQENFVNSGPYDGWVDYFDSYIGNNITLKVTQGYGSEAYDEYSIIPGYLETTQNSQTIVGSNTVTNYNLSQNIASGKNITVTVNGNVQSANTYTVVGTTLQFNQAPANIILPAANAQIVIYSGASEQTISSNGTVSSFTLGNLVLNPTTVIVNGVVQSTANYSVSSGTITFNTAPPLVIRPQISPTIVVSSGATVNQRGGVWQINIVNGVVNLTFVKEVLVNQKVQIVGGSSHSSSIYYYNNDLATGQTVPYYALYKVSQNAVPNPTTFNAGTTKFISNRDQYYIPGSQDKYIKFPQYGAFS